LFQIYHGICVPISIQIKKDMIKLLQKQNGAVFYASQCSFVSNAVLIERPAELLTFAQANLAD